MRIYFDEIGCLDLVAARFEPPRAVRPAMGGGVRLRVGDLTTLLDDLELPTAVRERLRGSSAEVPLSDSDLQIINDVCIAQGQEAGFDAGGSLNELGQRLEEIVDRLNAE